MKVLVTGGRGQLGRSVAALGASRGHEISAPDRDELDVCDEGQIAAKLEAFGPHLVINAAAYTAVDAAETDAARAYAVNRDGAGSLARACDRMRITLLHVSTDYVFGGDATRPYREDAPRAPLGVYGRSKADGEDAVSAAGATIVRTSWLFSARGPSFVHTILQLAKKRPILRVVADQYGCPTWADDLADALFELAARPDRARHYHYCGDGATTWHGFAVAVIDEARRHNMQLACEHVAPIATADYPTAARRPRYSVLDTSGIRALGIVPPSWKVGLALAIASERGECVGSS